MVHVGLPQESVLRLHLHVESASFLHIPGRGQSPLMMRSQFSVHHRRSQFKVSPALLIPLEHIHAAADVIIDGGCINRIATQSLLSDLSGFQEASECPCWLVHVIQHGPKTAVGECLVRVVWWQCQLANGSNILTYGLLIFATGLVDAAKTHTEEELFFGSQSGLWIFF